MKSIIIFAVLFTASLGVQASTELAKAKNCMTCHTMDKKLVGPGFAEIKAKYQSSPSSVAKLSAKIKKGGSGSWGAIPMPANPQVNEEEANILAKWILAN